MKKIIIIGGGAGGAKTASKAKRLNPDNEVSLFTMDDNIAISLCGLPYFIEGSVKNINNLIIRTPQDFQKMGINTYTKTRVEKIIPDRKKILVKGQEIKYDKLIIATGASVNIPDVSNITASGVYTLRSLKSALKIKEKSYTKKIVLIIGAGYISLELIEAFIANDLKVIVVEKNSAFLKDFDEDFSTAIYDEIIKKCGDKIQIYFNHILQEVVVDSDKRFIGAKISSLEDGVINQIYADFCVLATGSTPNVELARNCGITIGSTGAIEVDNKMRTNIEDIFAVGDCAQKYCLITRQPTYIGLGTIANKEGRVAAINAVNENSEEKFDGILSSTITRFFNIAISKTGLTFSSAQKYSKLININPIQTNIVKNDKASYMPEVHKINFKMTADKRTGEILGAQAMGVVGTVAQRINAITSAIKSELTIEEFLHLDLPYAPPFSSSIDPVLTAAYKLKEQMK